MFKLIRDIIAPPNTKRRLLATLLRSALKQPRDFFRYVNLSSFSYFLHYLRATDPELVEKMVAEVMNRDRAQADETARLNGFLLRAIRGTHQADRPPRRTEPVDVIIPVFNAYELTRACLASVLAHSENCRVIVVDDGSDDGRIAPLLAELKGDPARGIEVVIRRNAANLGFVQTVNQAAALATGHFVILNSDTEVPPGWLERLFAPILAQPGRVASVTPFSNAGMDCSFPEPHRDNPLFKGQTVTELDRFFRRYGGDEPVELFCGVGFCMAFNRLAVAKIGLFDAETFGRGYGEEVDWSLRAFDAGFRHLLAPNLFVYHKHGGSFGAQERKKQLERNQELIWKRHGGHMQRLREMRELDLPREVRETVALAVDAGTGGDERRLLLIDMDIPGGATIYSAGLTANFMAAGVAVVQLLFNHRQEYLKVRVASRSLALTVILPRDAATDLHLIGRFFASDVVIVNELVSWPRPLETMAQIGALGVPYLVMLHDYFLLCPSVFLVGDQGVFCSIPEDREVCRACLKGSGRLLHHEFYGHALDDMAVWRAGCRQFLAASRQVVCFSAPAMLILARAYPELGNVAVHPHALPNRERFVWQERHVDGAGPLHLGIIGDLFAIKGERLVADMVRSERFGKMAVKVTVFGSSPLYPAGHRSADGRLVFHGAYRQDELPELLATAGIHAILIPSICPETFSFTTSEALLLGYPVICFNLGAQAERVAGCRGGIVVAEISSGALLDAIQRLSDAPLLVAELSRNTRNYVPPTAEEHFAGIVNIAMKDEV